MTDLLRLPEDNFWKVFDDGPLGIAMVDMHHRYVKINNRLSLMYGYSEDEITQFTFPEITHPEDIEKDLMFAEQVIRGELPFCRLDKRMIRKDGTAMWANITASVLRSPEGEPLFGLSMVEDISERKRAEARYVEIIERLQSAVDGLTKAKQGELNQDLEGEGQASIAAASLTWHSPLALTTAVLEAIGLDEESFGFLVRYGRYAPDGAKYKINVGGLALSDFSQRTKDWFSLAGDPKFSIQVVDDGTGEFTIYLREMDKS